MTDLTVEQLPKGWRYRTEDMANWVSRHGVSD